MTVPCEVTTKTILPVARAMIARKLMENGLRQIDIAIRLGVSQAAVSLYGSRTRGTAIELEDEEVISRIEDVATKLARDKMIYADLVVELCNICTLIRKKGLMCKLHTSFNSSVDSEKCGLCIDSESNDLCIKIEKS